MSAEVRIQRNSSIDEIQSSANAAGRQLLTLMVILPPTVAIVVVDTAVEVVDEALVLVAVDVVVASPLANFAASMDMMHFTITGASITCSNPKRTTSAPAMP
jgi:hypothetical protein